MRSIFLFFLFCLSQTAYGQIEISTSPAVKNLVEAWEQSNFSKPYVSGWRVQISSTNDLRKADELKSDFARDFPGIAVDWVQEYPYYKVRVGAFLEKKESKPLVALLSEYYPGAFAAKDTKIPVSDF